MYVCITVGLICQHYSVPHTALPIIADRFNSFCSPRNYLQLISTQES